MIKSLTAFLLFFIITFSQAYAVTQDSIFDSSASSLFNNEQEFLTPEQAFNFNFRQQQDAVIVTFDIVDGYYLYRKQLSFKGDNVSIGEINLPEGVEHEDEFFGVQQIYEQPISISIPITDLKASATLAVRYQGCAKKGLCYPPEIQTIELINKSAKTSDILAAISAENQPSTNTPIAETKSSEQHKLAALLAENNLLVILIAFFLGGLLLSFTPCVFPMYPILTGIIVGQKHKLSTKHAFSLSFLYVQGMAVTYTILGIIVAMAGAQFQAMFQHPVVLITLSLLFIFLAFSMFGAFNLALPSSWQNKLTHLSNAQKSGSYTGVFAMGAISGLVASPCTTAPLTGALIYISQSGDIALGAAALYALSLGMGLPLLILGSSGGKLLPKAGPWMTTIKILFGYLLLTVPVFLLERFLPSNAIFVLAILILLSACAYIIRLSLVMRSATKQHAFAIFVLLLTLTASFQLAKYYQVLPNSQQSTKAFNYVKNLAELEQFVAQANAQGQTVMVDLYADWCIACKEFEHKTFPTSVVQQALANTQLVQIDLTDTGTKDSIELMKHFDVLGLPSILFFDLQGTELSQRRVTGFMPSEAFAKHVTETFTAKAAN